MVKRIFSAPGLGGFFYDDQRAIREGATREGFVYSGSPRTPGFSQIRMPARTLSVGLELEDGNVVWGDMMTVQYSGAGGREPPFDPVQATRILDKELAGRLLGSDVGQFRQSIKAVLAPRENGAALPLAMQYGISQALLRAAAHVRGIPMASVLAQEWSLPSPARGVPIYAQSGDERYLNVEKMVLKRADVLPHGLINTPALLGADGSKLLEYVRWVAHTVDRLGSADYSPTLHFDVYGTIGMVFDKDIEAMADFICQMADAAGTRPLNVESPGDFGSRDAQIEAFASLRARLRKKGCRAKLVADEWCDTLADARLFISAEAADLIQIKMPDVGSVADSFQAALDCKAAGIGAYMGGSCVETEQSAQVAVHVAVASQAEMQLAKPGMGVDEALSIVGNEQARLLARLKAGAG